MREMNPTALTALNMRIQDLERRLRARDAQVQALMAVEEKLRDKLKECREQLIERHLGT